MSNSSIISNAKNKIIREFIKDAELVAAIGATEIKSPEKLVNTHIFNYHQNPHTINTVGTFITIQVHIPPSLSKNRTFVNPTIEIWIISHEDHMPVNIPKVTANRNDYLSALIDRKLNGTNGLGIGNLMLKSNVEGSYQKNYLYRQMIFEATDLNDSLCNDE